VSRFLFFLLLIAIVAFGAHLWLSAPAEHAYFAARERNRDEIRIVAVTPPQVAARTAEETRRAVQSLAGAACVEFSGIAGADIPRAREAFAALRLGDRVTERRVEDVTRYWVFIPPARDRRAAETMMAQLRRQNVTDMSIRPDNSISLGVFSTEEGARRFLASVETKGVKEAEIGPFARDLREVVMLIREPDTETVARLAILQRDYAAAQLRAVPCPAPAGDAKP
jgi:hypothetical protein